MELDGWSSLRNTPLNVRNYLRCRSELSCEGERAVNPCNTDVGSLAGCPGASLAIPPHPAEPIRFLAVTV